MTPFRAQREIFALQWLFTDETGRFLLVPRRNDTSQGSSNAPAQERTQRRSAPGIEYSLGWYAFPRIWHAHLRVMHAGQVH